MASDETQILTVTEPTIAVDKMAIIDIEKDKNKVVTSVKPSKFLGSYIPYVMINGHEFNLTSIKTFKLYNTGFMPTLDLSIIDETGMFQNKHFAKDGDVINFYIRANNEKDYKPIRIDFDILHISPGGGSNLDNAIVFNINGQMKIPGLQLEESKAYTKNSSFDVLLKLSQELLLGFATNITDTKDKMSWICAYDTNKKFIYDVIANSYRDENSFFEGYIDPYYIFNFININGLFTVKDNVLESELYSTKMPDVDIDAEENAGSSKVPLMLTNNAAFQGTSKYLVSYKMNNKSGDVFLKNGYKRYAQYFDSLSDTYSSEFVEPFSTEGSDEQIHLKGRYVFKDGKKDPEPENITDKYIRYKFLGKQSTGENGNVHDNYMFSNILNKQNSTAVRKMGMICELPMADMTLFRHQRLPVLIYDYEMIIKETNEVKENNEIKEPTLNKFLSGYYVIDGIEYSYKYSGPITQKLYLIRREFNLKENKK